LSAGTFAIGLIARYSGFFCAPVEISVNTRSYGCPVSSISHSDENERERGDQ
jgi:hypothetical protein